MTRVGLLSDTHGYIDDGILTALDGCDRILHAGDIGSPEVILALKEIAPVDAVYGNIDDAAMRREHPESISLDLEAVQIYMTHIGGYPGRYPSSVRQNLQRLRPDLFICGHSHILKIMADERLQLLHMNPGAAGQHGFHLIRTVILFDLDAGKIKNVRVVELGRRGALPVRS
jgi:putative phosphoesterase